MTSRSPETEPTDPDIRMAYQSIALQGSLNWLVLTYGKACLQWSPALKLLAAGSHGLPELKQCIAQSEQSIFFAFLRIFVDGMSCFATITYIPEGTSGLRRARTSVAGRTVQSWFKGPQGTLTVSRLDDLTVSAIREAMPFTPIPPVAMARTSSENANPRHLCFHTRSTQLWGPAMRTELREAARRATEAEERAAVREEVARQARIKWLREEEARKAEEEEDERHAQLERDLARSAAVRIAESKRSRDAERRAEVARRLEEQRLEEVRRLEEVARAEEDLKRRAMEQRNAARVAGVKRRRESRLAGDSLLLSGWVTVQNSGSVAWRRRYFQLTDTLIRFFNKEKDITGAPVDVVMLKDVKPSVKEWYEGFEELRAIPHSFALILGNVESTMMFFSDTSAEKDLLSGLLMTCP
ncbi:hypothetical protein EI94DRAFT_1795510 [Lactarius quietus]|nr:hypothetical protein EI94DRAFT_1795510 [Lactarius quietus]